MFSISGLFIPMDEISQVMPHDVFNATMTVMNSTMWEDVKNIIHHAILERLFVSMATGNIYGTQGIPRSYVKNAK